MRFYRALLVLTTVLLLRQTQVWGQQRVPAPVTVPAAPPPQKVLKLQIILPSVVGRLGEMTGILVSPDKTKSARTSTSNPVLYLRIPLPRLLTGDAPKDSGK
ncbi:hypothetical protein CDA63_17730 [Hymenobacter amundsenii]|uniref:Uncharacterized protein n=1 Tax=Hymenobacter amundsenii TaxID=2006685 RepID=A0A246FGT5_9BACT|nr:hypothetical protein [Hymenobacter amundsenii]OWP61742.1 hypothetical protein CDA63_17730 [Hymenobacter amundsenii]